VNQTSGQIVFTSVANRHGTDGDSLDANIDVTCWDPQTGTSTTTTLGNIPTGKLGDDHNVAAIWQRPDGHYLAVYTGHNYGLGWNGRPHGSDTHPDTFYRISRYPSDSTAWQEERSFRWPSSDPVGDGRNGVTYSNLHFLRDESTGKGRLYNIARAAGQVWQIATSDDWGDNWTYRGRLSLPPAGGRAYSNGYLKLSDNGVDRIDFIMTEAHPRDFNNGLYHGYIQHGQTHNSAGTVIDEATWSESAPTPESFTSVFSPQSIGPGKYHTAWAVELRHTSDNELTDRTFYRPIW
jgi:hypothetical protein